MLSLIIHHLHYDEASGEAMPERSAEIYADIKRVLKPGGRLVIEEPDLNHKGVKLLALAEKILLMRSHFYAPQKIREMIASCGHSAKIENDGRYTAWVVAEK